MSDEKKPEGPRAEGADAYEALELISKAVLALGRGRRGSAPADRALAVAAAKEGVRMLRMFVSDADPFFERPVWEDVWPNEHPHHLTDPVEQEASYRRVLNAFRFKGASIPEHMHDLVVGYLVRHEYQHEPFLDAILENDFFHNFVSSPAWGSGERVRAWLELGRQQEARDAGVFLFKVGTGDDALTKADVGALVYAIDDETVGKAGPGRHPVGFLRHLDERGAWVLTKGTGLVTVVEAGADVEAGELVVIRGDGKAYPAPEAPPAAKPPVHFVWRGVMACGSNRDNDLIVDVGGSLAQRIAATTCETCKGLMDQLVDEVEPRTAPTIHLFRAATATALCGTTETVEGVSCYAGDYPEMVRKLNPEAVPCARCLEVSRT